MAIDIGSILKGALGGAAGGFSPSSSVSQSTPYYNESGIYFDSPGSGSIEGNSSDADATGASRQLAGGTNPLPASNFGLPSIAAGTATDNSLIYIIAGAAIGLLGLVYLLFKK